VMSKTHKFPMLCLPIICKVVKREMGEA